MPQGKPYTDDELNRLLAALNAGHVSPGQVRAAREAGYINDAAWAGAFVPALRQGESPPPEAPAARSAQVQRAPMSDSELLRRAILGEVRGLDAIGAARQRLGITSTGEGFPMEALSHLLGQTALEGAPPAPYELPSTADEAFLGLTHGTVAPEHRARVLRGLLGGIQKAGAIPSSMAQAIQGK